jgi:hypothetical protein
VTVTVCGVFVAPGADTVIVFVYVPGDRPAATAETVSVAFPVPLDGLTDSQAGADGSATAVQFIVPTPLFEREIVWLGGFVPWFEVKLRTAGFSTIVGDAALTV